MRRSAQVAASEQIEERLTKALADVAELRTLLAARDRQIEHLTKMLFARQSERIADDKHPKLPLVWDEPTTEVAGRLCRRRTRTSS